MPIQLGDVKSGYNLSVINENFQTIEQAWDEKLDRLVSSQGNQMQQTLDMNGNPIINTLVTSDPTSLVNRSFVVEYVNAQTAAITGVEGVVPLISARQIGDGVTDTFVSAATVQEPDNSFFVNIDGNSQRPNIDFYCDSSGDIVFSEAPPVGAKIDIVFFEPTIIDDPGVRAAALSIGVVTKVTVPFSGTEYRPNIKFNEAEISIDGVVQIPGASYSYIIEVDTLDPSFDQITFSEAVPEGSVITGLLRNV